LPDISEDLLIKILNLFPTPTITIDDVNTVFPKTIIAEVDNNGMTKEQVFAIRKFYS
jgi:hypothetical protein